MSKVVSLKCFSSKYSGLWFTLILSLISSPLAAERFEISVPEDAKSFLMLAEPVEAAYAKLGHHINLNFFPAKRSLLEAQKNPNIDGDLGRIAEAGGAYPGLLRVPVAIYTARAVGLTKQPTLSIQTIEDFQYHKLSAIRGIIFTDMHLKHFDTTYINDLEQGLMLLDTDRVDVFVIPSMYDLHNQALISQHELHTISLPFPEVKVYHHIHERHRALLPALTQAMHEVTRNPIEQVTPLVTTLP